MLRISVLQKIYIGNRKNWHEKIAQVEVLLISFHQFLFPAKHRYSMCLWCVCINICVSGWVCDAKVWMNENQCLYLASSPARAKNRGVPGTHCGFPFMRSILTRSIATRSTLTRSTCHEINSHEINLLRDQLKFFFNVKKDMQWILQRHTQWEVTASFWLCRGLTAKGKVKGASLQHSHGLHPEIFPAEHHRKFYGLALSPLQPASSWRTSASQPCLMLDLVGGCVRCTWYQLPHQQMLLYLCNHLCEIHIVKTLYTPSLHKSYNICSLHTALPFLLCGCQWTLPRLNWML